MGGDVLVAEAEPLRLHAVRGQFLLDQVLLAGPAPALLLVDAAAEGVHDGVEIRADPESEKGDVVTGVADDGDLGVGDGGQESAEKTGAADSTG